MKKLMLFMTAMSISAVIFAQTGKQVVSNNQGAPAKQAEVSKTPVKPGSVQVQHAKPPVTATPAAPAAQPAVKTQPSKEPVKQGTVHKVNKAPVKHHVEHAVPVTKSEDKSPEKK